MVENFAFYSLAYDALPEDQMRELAGEADFVIDQDQNGGTSSTARPT